MFEIEKYESFGFEKKEENLTTLKSVSGLLNGVDTSNLGDVEDARKFVVKLRGLIQKQGKSLREDAIAKQKRVLAEEKEYVAMLEPHEERFKQIEADIKEKEVLEARAKLLPWRKEQLQEIKAEMTDDEILAMDDTEFTAKLIELKEQKEEEARREEEMKKREAEAEERGRKEAEEKAQREKEEAERKAKEEEEAKKREEEKLAKQKKFKEYLTSIGYSEETKSDFKLDDRGDKVVIYKVVGEYIK